MVRGWCVGRLRLEDRHGWNGRNGVKAEQERRRWMRARVSWARKSGSLKALEEEHAPVIDCKEAHLSLLLGAGTALLAGVSLECVVLPSRSCIRQKSVRVPLLAGLNRVKGGAKGGRRVREGAGLTSSDAENVPLERWLRYNHRANGVGVFLISCVRRQKVSPAEPGRHGVRRRACPRLETARPLEGW